MSDPVIDLFDKTPDTPTPQPKRRRYLMEAPFKLEMLSLNNRAQMANLQVVVILPEAANEWKKQKFEVVGGDEGIDPDSISLESSDEFLVYSKVPPRTNPDGKPRKVKESVERWLLVSIR